MSQNAMNFIVVYVCKINVWRLFLHMFTHANTGRWKGNTPFP